MLFVFFILIEIVKKNTFRIFEKITINKVNLCQFKYFIVLILNSIFR